MEQGKLRKILLILLAVAVLLAAAAAVTVYAVWSTNEFTLELNMAGVEEITLEYGSDYTDAGATATFFGTILYQEPENVEVVTEGHVDTHTVGTHVVPLNTVRGHVLDGSVVEDANALVNLPSATHDLLRRLVNVLVRISNAIADLPHADNHLAAVEQFLLGTGDNLSVALRTVRNADDAGNLVVFKERTVRLVNDSFYKSLDFF